jgi:succinate dehydrogenase / fumarate reductase cytochrome b subunit
MAGTHGESGRPLSPHLQIYRLMLTTMMSIVHRMTGAALYLGTALLAWWLIAAASGPESFATVQGFMGSIIGRLILFGYTWALIHHMLGGLRHLVWDTGRGFDLKTIETMARMTLGGSVALTIAVWVMGYSVMGG